MTDREKLIELFVQECRETAEEEGVPVCRQDYCDERKEGCYGRVADRLIANGVTVQKSGEWIEKEDWNVDDYYYTCSACKEDFVTIDGSPSDNLWNYCPNCGADMRKEKTNDTCN